ncbi:MAG: DUF4270 domain-containing protein [Bacteroidetes bacterium]|nr:DUF4270 domain-containing protein [Bacteroidota bacterium]
MTKQLKWLLPAMLLAGVLTLNSCSEPDSVGIEVQPEGDIPGLFFTDTITIDASTVIEDSLRSDEGVAAFNLAGSYTDNVFGLSRASFYTQFFLPNNSTNFSFGTDPILDSVVLTLAYADYFGDTLTPMNLEVLQLEELMVIDSNYFTNKSLTTGQQLFSGTIEVRPKDSLDVDGGLRPPHLRLKMDNAWGTAFITSGNANFLSNDAFKSYFKGIQVKASDITAEDDGCVMSFNLLAAMSKMAFYYKNGTDTTQIKAYFEVNSGTPRFNHFEHDYTLADFGNTFPVSGADKLYVQSMSGVKVRLKFPHIRNLSAISAVSINKAELVLPVEDNTLYRNHTNLIVFGVDSAGAEALIPDLLESSSYYGGAYSATDKIYKFNIGRYIQRLVSDPSKDDFGISLVSSGGAINGFRTIIPGTVATGSKIQLRITYSKLD